MSFSTTRLRVKVLLTGISLVSLLFNGLPDIKAQGPTSAIGDRENLGVYGGPAHDLAFVPDNFRMFAAVQSPGTLFLTDDTCETWSVAFPFDSLEYAFGERGWGGKANRVLTNQKGWALAHTELEGRYSAAVVSYDHGVPNTFKTAIDPFLLTQLTGDNKQVSAIALTDHFVFSALGNFLIRTNDTVPLQPDMIIARLDTIPGAGPDIHIKSIAASNNPGGFPIYIVAESTAGAGDGILYRYDGTAINPILTIPSFFSVNNVFGHSGTTGLDTAFISCTDINSQSIVVLRTLDAWGSWMDITPSGGTQFNLADADFSPFWLPFMPFSEGLRLSFPGGRISDDLGVTWSAQPLEKYGIASHPLNQDLIAGSTNVGVAVSEFGVTGPFITQPNIGFAAVNVHNFSSSLGVYYIATDAGLAYTEAYSNQTITGYNQWIPPNGLFPVPGVGDSEGVSAVEVDPADSLHVICGYKNGFFVSFNGPNNFVQVTPIDWNNTPNLDPYVTDIHFVTSNIVIAVTGYKFRRVATPPQQEVGNIWRSNDGGLTWNVVTPYFPELFTMGNCIASEFNGFEYTIYAGSGFGNWPAAPVPGALWKSIDMGLTWIKVNNGPQNALGEPQPVFDIDILSGTTEILYLSANETFARSDDGGISYFYPYIPGNTGSFYSALIDQAFPDSVSVSAGRHIYKYNYLIDDSDLKFKGYPGEEIHTLAYGSTLSGSTTGAYKTTEAVRYYLALTAFLEGPFATGTMSTALNSGGFLPLSQPFNTCPWNYKGTESVSAIPNTNIVDWVLVELRETAGDSTTATSVKRINRQACFILNDGTIVGKDGVSDPRFNFTITEDLYGIIYHPNHVEIMSANGLLLNSETFEYDFTSGEGQVYGGGNGHKQLASGIWGMASGDGNGDGQVNLGDKNDVWAVQSGMSGYLSGDFNLDSQVNNGDKVDYWAPNAGFGSQVVP